MKIGFSCILQLQNSYLQNFSAEVAFRPLQYDHLYAIFGLQDPQLSTLPPGPA